jgi:hypothetical protein
MARESKNHSLILSHPRRPSLYFLFFFFSFRVLFPVVYSITQTQNKLFSSFLPSWCWRRNNMCERKKRSNNLLWGCLSYIRNSMMVEGGERERRRVETIRRTSLLYGMRRQTVVAATHTASMGPIIRFVIGAAVIHCCITTLSTVG